MQFYKQKTQRLQFGFPVLQVEVPLCGHGSLVLSPQHQGHLQLSFLLGFAELPTSLELCGDPAASVGAWTGTCVCAGIWAEAIATGNSLIPHPAHFYL